MSHDARKQSLKLRQVWLGKQTDIDDDAAASHAPDPPGDAMVPADSDAPNAPASSARAAENKQQKELRDLKAYLKKLNAKTNLLDLASEVLSDRKLLMYGWMRLDSV